MSKVVIRSARAGEAESLTALCVRSKAHWGYDDAFMRLSQASLTVSDADIASGRVLVATDDDLIVGVARVESDGELGVMFVDPPAMGRGAGRALFAAAAALARRLGARSMAILADPNAAPFYERMGARFVSHAPSDAIPGRTLPLYEYELTHEETPMTPLSPPATIAFIGLGMMGRPMASRLAGAGFTLRVFDVSQKAVSDFVGTHPSALATASAKAAAEGAAALITMLPDGKIVRQAVLEGRDAAVDGLAPGAVVLDMSSSNPVDTQKLARDLAARGLALLDAPVSGGVKRAVDGSLSIMVGGAAADLERVRPVFGAMGKTITLCGPAGAGHALKALNNYLSAAGLVAMCEALVVGEAFGLDPGTMVDVFNSSTGKSNATEVKGRQFVVSRTFAAGFTTALMAKDLRTAGEVANHLELNMPNLQQAVAYWTDADGKLGKGADHTEIFSYAERLAEKEA